MRPRFAHRKVALMLPAMTFPRSASLAIVTVFIFLGVLPAPPSIPGGSANVFPEYRIIRILSPSPAWAAEDSGARSDKDLQLPHFEGRTLSGQLFDSSAPSSKRRIVFCFNPGIAQAEIFAQAVQNLAAESQRNNFEIIGVALGLSVDASRDFSKRLGLTFPIIDDSEALISATLGLQSPVVVVGVEADGSVALTMGSSQHQEAHPLALIENHLREFLRLAPAGALQSGQLRTRPAAPLFEAKPLKTGETFRLADLAGKPVVLVFFLHSCPHCHEALRFFRDQLAKLPEATRPVLIGVSSQDRSSAALSTLAEEGLDFFPAVIDPEREIRNAYGVFAGTPDTFLIDAEGGIAHRIQGWNSVLDPPVASMYLAQMSRVNVPMLINREGFSGNQVCTTCHAQQAATWEFTAHATAFNALIPVGAAQKKECVGCHVVGFGKAGGFELDKPQTEFENVGCESCHGMGGGHLDAVTEGSAKPGTDYRAACLTCHNETHSMGFEFNSFLEKVSHASIAEMTGEQREALLEGRDKPRDLLSSNQKIVGSEACKSCHESEYKTWKGSAHAQSLQSLERRRSDKDSACMPCHVTGFGQPGGFEPNTRAWKQPELAKVGCESCHGAGEAHVQEGARHTGDIVKLGDKCDSCVILQICGSCHDDTNDPEFRFHIPQKIELQKHGGN